MRTTALALAILMLSAPVQALADAPSLPDLEEEETQAAAGDEASADAPPADAGNAIIDAGDAATSEDVPVLDAEEPQPLSGGAFPQRSRDPLLGLAQGFAAGSLDAQGAGRLIDAYHRSVGLARPMPSPSAAQAATGSFAEDETLPLTHEVGDVDGDGTDDVILDLFCTEFQCFFSGSNTIAIPPGVGGKVDCGTRQELVALSGSDGSLLWKRTLSQEFQDLQEPETVTDIYCGAHHVVGTTPLGDGTEGLLIYSYAIVALGAAGPGAVTGNPSPFLLEHQLLLVEPRNGTTVWTIREEGEVVMQDTCITLFRICISGSQANGNRQNTRVVVANNLLVNPMPMDPRMHGVQLIGNATERALFQQFVSFDYLQVRPAMARPGEMQSHPIRDHFMPREKLAKVDEADGSYDYQVDTFTPQEDRSVMPNTLQTRTLGESLAFWTGYGFSANDNDAWRYLTLGGIGGDTLKASNHYWRYVPCCFDATGDGVPDILYSTLEWNPEQSQNVDGPYTQLGAIVLFDGATGQRVHRNVIEPDTRRFINEEIDDRDAFLIRFERLGDADGDGLADFLVHRFYLHERFRHVVSVHSGATGELLWEQTNTRHVLAVPIGDADQDGGNDILLIDWFDWQYPFYTTYDLMNATAIELRVVSGASGDVLWTAETFNAPIDMVYTVDSMKVSGMPDMDADGVGEVFIDDPIVLEDGTVVHHRGVLSGRDGAVLHRIFNAGIFSFPVYLHDLDGDGRDGYGIVSGDPMDVWFTAYDDSGTAEWSRRLTAERIDDFLLAVPRSRTLALDGPNETNILLNFQFEVTKSGYFGTTQSVYPQVSVYTPRGSVPWAYPVEDEDAEFITILGATPGSAAFKRTVEEAGGTESLAETSSEVASVAWPSVTGFIVAFGVAHVLAFRRWSK